MSHEPAERPSTGAAAELVRPNAWARALRDLRAQQGTRLAVLLVAGSYANASDGRNVYPGTARLAADVGCNERTVREALSWAVEHGWLVLERRGGRAGDGIPRASRYRLSQPAPTAGLRAVPVGSSTGADLSLNRVSDGHQPGLTAGVPSHSHQVSPPPDLAAEESRMATDRPRSSQDRAELAERPPDGEGAFDVVSRCNAARTACGRPPWSEGEVHRVLKVATADGARYGGRRQEAEDRLVVLARDPETVAPGRINSAGDALATRGPAADTPAWCGQCSDPRYRQVGRDSDAPARCPRCHPLEVGRLRAVS